MNQGIDGLVIGAGVVGLSLALGLAKRGKRIAVLDKGSIFADTSGIDKRVYAFNHASQELFLQIGAWSMINKNRVAPYLRMNVWDAASSGEISFDCRDIAKSSLGVMVEESILKEALIKTIANQPLITLYPDETVIALTETSMGMNVVTQQATHYAPLVIIADGALSSTRDLLQVTMTTWPYHQEAVIATVKTSKPHDNTAYQVFTAQGPLAFLPLSDAYHCSIVWSSCNARALMALSDVAFGAEITEAFQSRLGPVTLESPRFSYPLVMRHVNQYVGAHWVLMGDAAHTIHPLAGLGLNLGLADVTALLKLHDEGLDLFKPRTLKAYQRQRKVAVWKMILAMQGLKTLFTSSLKPVTTLRGLGLSVCHQLPMVKRLLIEQATGLSD